MVAPVVRLHRSMDEAGNDCAARREEFAMDPTNTVQRRVLVVDDEAAIRHFLSGMLKREGFDVAVATNGREALELFEQHRPDVVLLDVTMPGMTGFEVCEHLKGDPETRLIPIIIVTASSSIENRMRGLEVGADDFLSKPVDRLELIARVRSLVRIKGYMDELEQAEAVLCALARSIEGKDPYTEGHCERLSVYAEKLARHLERPRDEIIALRRAGVVHDIGKVAVPDAVLLKAGPLDATEMEIIKQHPVVGESICKSLKSFRLVLPIIRHHHERADGSGYPDGLKGEAIPLTARILQVVDVFDALTTERPYRRALPIDEALEIMRSEVQKGWWDAEIFAAFEQIARAEGFRLEGSPVEAGDLASFAPAGVQ